MESADQIGFPLWLKADGREKTPFAQQGTGSGLFDSVCRSACARIARAGACPATHLAWHWSRAVTAPAPRLWR